jgi:hypothetical protein
MSLPRKSPNLWILVGVTYGAVVVTTILALVGYHRLAGTKSQEPERAGNISVGAVWVPMYPNASVHGTTSSTNGDITEGTMKFSTGDSFETVLSFYRTGLRKSGLQLEANADPHKIRAIGRAGKIEVVISADPHGEGSEAQIATVDREKK